MLSLVYSFLHRPRCKCRAGCTSEIVRRRAGSPPSVRATEPSLPVATGDGKHDGDGHVVLCPFHAPGALRDQLSVVRWVDGIDPPEVVKISPQRVGEDAEVEAVVLCGGGRAASRS